MIAALLCIAAALAALAFFSLLRIASQCDEEDVPDDVRTLAHYERLLRQRKGIDPRDPDYEDLPDLDAYGLRAGIYALLGVAAIVALNALGLAIDEYTGMDVEIATTLAVGDLGGIDAER